MLGVGGGMGVQAALGCVIGQPEKPIYLAENRWAECQAVLFFRLPLVFRQPENGLGFCACFLMHKGLGCLGVGMAAQRHEMGSYFAGLGQPERVCHLATSHRRSYWIYHPPVMDKLVISPTFLSCR